MKRDESLCVLAMVCSSFVAINRGTNCRYPYAGLGDEDAPSVCAGNRLASRKPVVIINAHFSFEAFEVNCCN